MTQATETPTLPESERAERPDRARLSSFAERLSAALTWRDPDRLGQLGALLLLADDHPMAVRLLVASGLTTHTELRPALVAAIGDHPDPRAS
jgi:hypothetical protein